MRTAAEILAIAGSVLVALAAIGTVRLPDVYARMHAASKASTLGIALLGLATMVGLAEGRAKVAVTVIVLFVTAPVAAHLLGRAAYRAEGIPLRIEAVDDLADLVDADTPDGTAADR